MIFLPNHATKKEEKKGNTIFLIISLRMNVKSKLLLKKRTIIAQNIIIKNTIFIFENEMYDNKYFCDLIILILDTFKKHLDNKKEISLDIDQENDFIIVKVTGKLCIKELEINNEIQRLIDILDADYSLSKINDIFTLKFIVTLK